MNASQVVAGLRALSWLAIGIIAVWLLSRIHYTLVTFGLAALLSYLLYPVVSWLFTHGIALFGRQPSWSLSVLMVYATLPVVVGIALWISVPALTAQIETISRNLPTQMERVQGAVAYWQTRFDRVRLPQAVRDQMQALVTQSLNRFADVVGNLVGHVANGLLTTLTWASFVAVALIISNLILLTLPETLRAIDEAVPERFRGELRQLMYEVNIIFGGFLKGTFILSTLAAVGVYLLLNGLTLLSWLGVPGMIPFQYSLVLALATLVLYPIPLLGLVGLILIGTFAAYVQEGTTPMYVMCVVGIMVSMLLAVDRIVGPRIMSQAMGVSPLFVMFAAFAGAELMGFWGMILGVPMAAVVKVVFRYVRARFLLPKDDGLGANPDSQVTASPDPEPLTHSALSVVARGPSLETLDTASS